MAKLNSFWTLLLLLVACVSFVYAQDQEDKEYASANLEVTADFPDNPFGHIINGQKNKVVLKLANKDNADFSVLAVSGKVSPIEQPDKTIRNLTALRYDLTVTPEGAVEIPYLFHSEFAPGDLALTIFIDVLGGEKLLRVVGYDGIVTIVDPETSWIDPQLIFLYVVLSAFALGVAYIINAAFFGGSKPAKAKASKEPAVKPTHRDDKGQMILDESWIPQEQLGKSPKQSPRAKKRTNTGRK